MEKIYLDNASTTFPKPPQVAEAVYRYMTQEGANINRGCYDSAYQVEETVFMAHLLAFPVIIPQNLRLVTGLTGRGKCCIIAALFLKRNNEKEKIT